ncbi:MAG: Tuberous sclerosis 2-like protein [Chrysothrix sp. TS-e1954]|nr:MAG: Tuberous sclerosis 2-like protein [Chrysothrix sp. TS-e1954]
MSRANEDENPPQTPRPKPSSSSLLAAFRGLTGTTKSKAQSSATSPESQFSITPAFSSREPSEALTVESPVNVGLDRVEIDEETDGADAGVLSEPGIPGISTQLEALRAEKPLEDRVEAASSIIRLLERHRGGNVLGIWEVAEDLLDLQGSSEALNAAYGLLIACVRHKALTSRERRRFFDSIPRSDNAASFFLRFQALKEISEDGKNVECLEFGVMPLLVRLLRNCYVATASAKKDSGRRRSATGDEQRHLDMVFTYILGVIKHNSKVFNEQDLSSLVNQISWLCSKTTSTSDISCSIDIMDALITYSSLPSMSLRMCLELLGGIYGGPKELKEQRLHSWKTLVNLLGSHLGPATINTLLAMLKELPTQRDLNSNILRGAVLIFCEVIRSDDTENLPPTSLTKVVSAARQSLEANSSRLEMAVMELMLVLMQSTDPMAVLFDDKTWSNVIVILVRAASRAPKKEQNDLSRSDEDQEPSFQQLLQGVADRLLDLTNDASSDQRDQVMKLLMQIVQRLNDDTARALITFVAEECLLYPFNDGWQVDFDRLFDAVFQDSKRSFDVRKLSLGALYDAYKNGEALSTPNVDDYILKIIGSVRQERNLLMVQELCNLAVITGAWTPLTGTFVTVVGYMEEALNSVDGVSSHPTSPQMGSRKSSLPLPVLMDDGSLESFGLLITKALVRMFLRNVSRSAWKSAHLFDVFLRIAGSISVPADARIMAFKVLFRLRADTNHAIFVVSSTYVESIAALLCRTSDTVNEDVPVNENAQRRSGKTDEHMARRSNQGPGPAVKALTRPSSTNTKLNSSSGRISRPTPPLWLYLGPKGLPEEPDYYASHVVDSVSREPEATTGDVARVTLQISKYLELLISILQQDELDWEVFSYILVHLGAQLTNHALFADAITQVKFLRGVLCGQLSSTKFHKPPAFTSLNKSDVAICMYHVLTMLISYHDHFSSNEESEVVKILALGIGSWERTSETCIHALSICCHELPLSVVKSLENILQRLSQIITQSQLAVHVLEFLATLARLPNLYKNLREDDFKMVFGICFRFLQSVRDAKAKAPEPGASRLLASVEKLPSSSNREVIDSNDGTRSTPTLADDLPQYVYALVYQVMSFWFMSLRLEDRPKHVAWITRNLTYTTDDGRLVMEEQAQVTIDMMHRISYSDRDETAPDAAFATEYDGVRTTQSWIVGLSIVTIETAGRTGISQIARRRPTGTRFSVYRPQLVSPPRHQVPITFGLAAESYYTPSYVGIMPSDILQEFYSPLNLHALASFSETPIPLPCDEGTTRAIGSFDRISPLDGHKVGIIYIGESQSSESEILANVMGSADYTYFLRNIGTLIELKNAQFNTQGLDRESDIDGKFTFCWRDRVTELVFHVPTMMPTNLDQDPNCTLKKRHIGNDFVKIIFNNSGHIYDTNTIPSDFNLVNIVITPEARASFVETRLEAATKRKETQEASETGQSIDDPYGSLNYRVTVLTAIGIPRISPAAETKIISGSCLPGFVRLLALNASVFAQVWAHRESAGGEGASSWRNRLREIMRLRERHGAVEPPTNLEAQNRSGPSGSVTDRNSSAIPQASSISKDTRDSALFRRTSAANIHAVSSGYPSGITDSTWETSRNSGFTTSSSNATTDADKDRPISELSPSRE